MEIAGIQYFRIILDYGNDGIKMYGIGLDGDWNDLSRHEVGIVVILNEEMS